MGASSLQVFRTAITNWVWLAELEQSQHALVLGDHPGDVRAGLERHFDTVHHRVVPREAAPRQDLSSIALPHEEAFLDCVVLDQDLGAAAVAAPREGALRFLEGIRFVLRDDGCVFIPLTGSERMRPRRFARRLRGVGYRRVRSWYVYEALDRPGTLVPARRAAAAYFEVFAWGSGKGRLRGLASAVGLHGLLHRAMIMLAYR